MVNIYFSNSDRKKAALASLQNHWSESQTDKYYDRRFVFF